MFQLSRKLWFSDTEKVILSPADIIIGSPDSRNVRLVTLSKSKNSFYSVRDGIGMNSKEKDAWISNAIDFNIFCFIIIQL